MPKIVPAILVQTEKEFKEKLSNKELLKAAPLWQFDILDGSMFDEDSWADFEAVQKQKDLPGLELHLMIEHPVPVVKSWVDHVPTVKRAIIHAEIGSPLHESLTAIKEFGIEAGLALNPETSIDDVEDAIAAADMVLVMGVYPGKSGQNFLGEPILKKIKALKERFPEKLIAVDGGTNQANARDIINAGASQLCMSSGIWGAENPLAAYKSLTEL